MRFENKTPKGYISKGDMFSRFDPKPKAFPKIVLPKDCIKGEYIQRYLEGCLEVIAFFFTILLELYQESPVFQLL